MDKPGCELEFKNHLRFPTRDTEALEYKPSIDTAYQRERQLLLDRNSSFTTTANELTSAKSKPTKDCNWGNAQKDKSDSTNWGTTARDCNWDQKDKPESNWGNPAKNSNWGSKRDQKTDSANWGTTRDQTTASGNWGKPSNEYNSGKPETQPSESSNWGQSAKSTEQENQPKLPSLMPQRNKRKRARNSESADFDTRDSCGALKKTVTNIHDGASAYVPTMNKG